MAVLSAKEGEKQMEKAKVHIYCGDGKGKTTAAIGLSVRSCGRGWPVVLSQFLKGSTSGELNVLRTLPDYHYIPAPTTTCKFIFQMTEQEKADYGRQVRRHFADTVEAVEKYHAKLLVLDEVLDAVAMGMLSDEELADFLRNRPADLEVVMTGRAPTPCTDPWLTISPVCRRFATPSTRASMPVKAWNSDCGYTVGSPRFPCIHPPDYAIMNRSYF